MTKKVVEETKVKHLFIATDQKPLIKELTEVLGSQVCIDIIFITAFVRRFFLAKFFNKDRLKVCVSYYHHLTSNVIEGPQSKYMLF